MPTITIGSMRSVVKFEKNEPVATPTGGEKAVYSEVLTTRGYLRSRSGSRTLQGGQLEINSSHELTVRLFAGIESNLAKDLRVIIDNRFFTINDWQKVDEKRFFYVFQLSERK